MNIFLRKLIYLIPIIITVILSNYIIDPANLFSYKSKNANNLSTEQQIADYILEGYNVTNFESYDERLFHKIFIQSIINKPEVVVLGSSRSQLIDKNALNSSSVINNSVTGATIEDILALYCIHETSFSKPSKLLVEISPWMLNENNQQSRWIVLEEEYNSFLEKLKQNEEIDNKVLINPRYKELISFEYFQESIKYHFNRKEKQSPFLFIEESFNEEYPIDSLYNAILISVFSYRPNDNESKIDFLNRVLLQENFYEEWQLLYKDFELMDEDKNLINETLSSNDDNSTYSFKENIIKRNRKLMESCFWQYCPITEESSMYRTLNKNNSSLTILTDGTISYPENFRNREGKQVLYAANKFSNKIFGLSNFTEISESKLELLIKFIDYLNLNQVEMEILILPYHPLVYEKIEINHTMVIEVESKIKLLAQSKGINCYGSYNPNNTNSSNSSFYDGMHLKPLEIEKILKTKYND